MDWFEEHIFFSFLIGCMAVIVFIFGGWLICVNLSVWSSQISGKSKLAEAKYSRQIMVAEALAKKDSAKLTAEADVIRARGIAQANKVIGKSLEENEKYLEWKFIDELPQSKNQIIYLPTSAFLPVLEANRIKK